MTSGPSIAEISALRDAFSMKLVRTPLMRCAAIELALDNGTRVWGKLEFLQRTGTFKARGALANLHALTREQLDRGVTAVTPCALPPTQGGFCRGSGSRSPTEPASRSGSG